MICVQKKLIGDGENWAYLWNISHYLHLLSVGKKQLEFFQEILFFFAQSNAQLVKKTKTKQNIKQQQKKKTRKTKQSKTIITTKNSILTTLTNSAFLLLEMVNVLTLCQAFLISFFRSPIYFCFTHTDCTLVRKRIPQGGRPSLQRRYMNHSSNYETELRWLDTVFQGQYLPSLRINYVAINKVLEKLPPQLYFLFNH